jgi:hypothetical protein
MHDAVFVVGVIDAFVYCASIIPKGDGTIPPMIAALELWFRDMLN